MGSATDELLEQPLILSSSPPSSGSGPRILDRDGTFSQSRGRWSVSNINSNGSSSSSSTRQRRAAVGGGGGVTPTDGSMANNAAEGVPYGVAPPSPPPPPPPRRSPTSSPPSSLMDRLCCSSNVLCCCRANDQPRLGRRCWDDWFHTLSYTPTCVLMLGVFAAYTLTIVIFAGLYLAANKTGMYYEGRASGSSSSIHGEGGGIGGGGGGGGEANDLSLGSGAGDSDVDVSSFCGMDINNHMEALYFSLSTMATIGYGTSDYYFGECWTPFILVLFQVFSAIVFSSLAIGLLFQRMSRGQKRGRTIVFSDVAVIRKVRGRWYWMFRVAELRKRHIIGAKVRVFCVRHERCPVAMMVGGEGEGGNNHRAAAVELETAHFVSHPLPLLNGSRTTSINAPPPSSDENEEGPNSECSFEQNILMGLPHVVVHRMDSLSPMMPPRPVWYDEGGVPHTRGGGPSIVASTTLSSSSEAPTEGTAESSARGEDTAPSSLLATGGTDESPRGFWHALEEGREAPPPPSSALLLHPPYENNDVSQPPTQEEITHFIQDRQAEIIVFLEGVCEVTGMALQARHSYKTEDIAFHQTFAPCVFPAPGAVSSTTRGKKKKWWNNPFSKSKARVDNVGGGSSGGEVYTFKGNAALEIDFSQFHDLEPVPHDSMSCPYIPSSSMRKR